MMAANGSVVWDARYEAFGKAIVVTEQVENNLRFPGQYFDGETGLHHNYFRDYDAGLGRYLQGDPIGLLGGINSYGYAAGNPLMYSDPYGLWCIGPDWTAAIAGALGGAVTGGLSGGGFAGAAIGFAAGGVAGYAGSAYGGEAGGFGAAGLGAAVGIAGGIGKAVVAGGVGGAVGGATSYAADEYGGALPNAAGGLWGGALGGHLQPDTALTGNSGKGSKGSNMLRGGWAGLAGGLVQDFFQYALTEAQDCDEKYCSI